MKCNYCMRKDQTSEARLFKRMLSAYFCQSYGSRRAEKEMARAKYRRYLKSAIVIQRAWRRLSSGVGIQGKTIPELATRGWGGICPPFGEVLYWEPHFLSMWISIWSLWGKCVSNLEHFRSNLEPFWNCFNAFFSTRS